MGNTTNTTEHDTNYDDDEIVCEKCKGEGVVWERHDVDDIRYEPCPSCSEDDYEPEDDYYVDDPDLDYLNF